MKQEIIDKKGKNIKEGWDDLSKQMQNLYALETAIELP